MIDAKVEISNPFPGLRSFREEESHLFFGREQQVDELLIKLRRHHFIALVGMSGSGKSSLLVAGVIPALKSGFLTVKGSSWEVGLCRAGHKPLRSLAKALLDSGVLHIQEEQPESIQLNILETKLSRSASALAELLAESRLPVNDNFLIIVDQFEDLFQYNSETDQKHEQVVSFAQLLLHATTSPSHSVYVVVTMRSDYLDHCARVPGLIEAINRSQHILPPMSREQLDMAISGPAKVGGVNLSASLKQQILNDLHQYRQQLPILQHTLMRTWDYWYRGDAGHPYLDLQHYEAVGTMDRALSLHAEEVFHELSDQDRILTQKIFKTITEQQSAGRKVRKPNTVKRIAAIANTTASQVKRIVNYFAQESCSFLVTHTNIRQYQELDGSTVVDVAHESLIYAWSRLSRWVEEESEAAQIYLQLCQAAKNYEQGRTGLMQDPELTLSMRWYSNSEHEPNEAWASRYDPNFQSAIAYLLRSKQAQDWAIEQEERIQQKQLKKSRRVAALFGLLSTVAVAFLIWAIILQAESQQSLKRAKQEKAKAKQSSMEAANAREQALASEQEAFRQKERALQNERKAREQSIIAQRNAEMAQQQRARALQNEEIAKQQAKIAEQQRIEAERQRLIAENKQQEAEKQERIAKQQRERAEQLSMKSLSKALAASSLRMIEEDKQVEKAQLALQAYRLHQKYGDFSGVSELFAALLQANQELKATIAPSYTVPNAAVTVIGRKKNSDGWISGSSNGSIAIHQANGEVTTLKACQDGRCAVKGLLLASKPFHPFIAVSAHEDPILRLWYQNKQLPERLDGHKSPIRAVCLSNNGQWLYSGDSKGQIGVWSANDKVRHTRWLQIGERVTAIEPALNPEKAWVATDKAQIYLLSPNGVSKEFSDNRLGAVLSMAFCPKQNLLIAGNRQGKILFIYLNTGRIEAYSEHKSGITGISISDDGRHMATCSFDKTVKIFDLEHIGEKPIVIQARSWVRDVEFIENGSAVLFSSENQQMQKVPINLPELAKSLCQILKEDTKVPTSLWTSIAGDEIPQAEACP